ALRQLSERRERAKHGLVGTLKRPAVAATLGAMVLALGAAGGLWARGAEARWARAEALTEIAAFTETGELYEAFRLARRAEKYRPDDPALEKMLDRITLPIRITTKPAGAEVWVKGYATPDAAWEPIGVTPVALRVPYAMMRWRITKPGYEPFEGAPFSGIEFRAFAEGLPLDSLGTRPLGMVRILPGRLTGFPGTRSPDQLPAAELGSYFLDRFEVTNRDFKRFVDAGGYRDPRWWQPGIAINAFRDATGRHGPSTWQLGTYPAGEDDHPVGGISWYEAAAYCAFVGKALPTVYHWFRAIGQEQLSDILVHSNMGGGSKARVGQFRGLAAYGTYDMAGNVKEWTWNAIGDKRYILGGAWNEPQYVFRHLIAHPALSRDPTHGVRCAKYTDPPSELLLATVTPEREQVLPEPISEESFALLRGMYAYDRTPLEAEVVRVDDSMAEYRRETVSIRTAYADERMEIHLFIPRSVAPPYQSVIWFPGDDVFLLRSSEYLSSSYLVDFIPRGGRVLVQPVYDAMYERYHPRSRSPSELRDLMIRWSQDIGRTIDYLETRPDFDTKKIGYYGLSGGASRGAVFTAVEPRIAAAILLGGGLPRQPHRPETHVAHFAPRSRTPTLMINGRDDFIATYELSQKPLFELLGAPEGKKRHAVLDGGHIPADRLAIIREVFDWLDEQLGPVRPATSVANVVERR
ncbi:MAG: SUMF1/EgtB/PvdO family nonheme iron enzyme, partial [Gemmatimonadota bacterium]|nr:SUMF1/EgtB/PvdO family nonheme iron enzyme [Gemmatimonadota bacterium]